MHYMLPAYIYLLFAARLMKYCVQTADIVSITFTFMLYLHFVHSITYGHSFLA